MNSISIKCSICGKEQHARARATFPDGRVALSCNYCDVAFVHPQPSHQEIAAYYSSYPTTVEQSSVHGELLASRHRPIFEYLLGQITRGLPLKILDFGFGAGAFLKFVARNGCLPYGADFSEQNCAQIKEYSQRTGLEIVTVNLSEYSLDRLDCQGFDVITLFQAIEHLSDPVEVLRDLAARLAPGGVIYVECPNEGAWYLRVKNVLRRRFNREGFFGSLNPPQHLFGFSRKSMKLALKQANLEILECSDYAFGDGIHQVQTLDWYPTIGQWCAQKAWWNLYGLVKLFIRTMDPLMAKMFGMGGGLFALARKSD